MNNENGDAVHQRLAAVDFSAVKKPSSNRQRAREARASRHRDNRRRFADGGEAPAGRLGQPEACAFIDPTDPRASSSTGGAAGSPRRRALSPAPESARRADLAGWQQGTTRRTLHDHRRAGPPAPHRLARGGDGFFPPASRDEAANSKPIWEQNGTNRCGRKPARLAAPPQGSQRPAADRRGRLRGGRAAAAPISCRQASCRA